MSEYIQWVLRREHQGCSATIPVPSPIHTGTIADLEGMLRGERRAAFLCPGCGLVMLYSDTDLGQHVLATPDPYLQEVLDLVYVEGQCVYSNCGSLIPIHAVWDVAKATFATMIAISDWRFDDSVKCKQGHPRRLPLRRGNILPYYRADAPF